MSSIMTNGAAIAALASLRAINSALDQSQIRISSGYRVGSAADNAAYWSIATTMRSDERAMGAAGDALALGAATVDTAYSGMAAAVEIVDEFKAKLVAARQPGVDKEKINTELTQLKEQLRTIVDSSSFSGQNWLEWNTAADSDDKTIVSSFVRDAAGAIRLDTLKYDVTTGVGVTGINYLIDNGGAGQYGILTSDAFATSVGAGSAFVILKGASNPPSTVEIILTQATTETEVEDMVKTVDAMLLRMTDVTATLGALKSRIDIQNEFLNQLRSAVEVGVGQLVDADMNEEATRMKALQTQQQLGIQALSIANSNAQNILSLFR
ncbi:flagellin [Peteryoungia desertarenae]|uniref:Flagellin n=1 Tax=Peteryoungia desertarenae TaxID=1813451 RepID=A0ABX6QMZ2_9HYPH|nr:flagellin [Peteryoungia desertarenae]QLF69949.1 flagellin [Peteryoungia desertarenae]